jgi:gluconolactonase
MKSEMKVSEQGWLKKARVRKLAGGFEFTEGPVWHPGQYFLFSDTPANCIYQLFPDGTINTYLQNSGLNHNNTEKLSHQVGSNGLALDACNNLYICQHGNHGIAVLNGKKELRTLLNEYRGAPFNSPNDITLRSDGIVYFTDPPYGLADETLFPASFQPCAGVYKYDFNTVTRIATDLQYPNGIVFSPNEKYLYISTNHPAEKNILRYTVAVDGGIHYDSVLIEENADGITIDKMGNLYMATGNGILSVSPQGKRLGLIALPDTPTNLTWGPGEEILFVTAGSSIYFIEK